MANNSATRVPNRAKHTSTEDSDTMDIQDPVQDLVEYARKYARERPGVVALWCLGAGFILGWKLKPW